MKKKLLIILCAGMMMTGCADKGVNGQEEPEVAIIDFNGNAANDDAEEERSDTADGEDGETIQKEEDKESQIQEESVSKDDIEDVPNDEKTQDLYLQFISNEVPVIVGDDFPKHDWRIFDLERGKSYTFAELGKYVDQSYFDPEYSQKTSHDYVQYTYVECLDGNSRNFLIKFVGLNLYAQDDDSFVVYVITEKNGQLYLTEEYECWARSYIEQYRNGLCGSGGSGGAGDHYAGMSAILSDGKMTNIYGAEILSGWWISYVDGTIYSEVFDENMEIPMNVSIYTIGENEYYTYDLSDCTDDQLTLCETYISRCRDEAGVSWVTEEEVQDAVKQRCSALNISYNALEQQEIAEWTNL